MLQTARRSTRTWRAPASSAFWSRALFFMVYPSPMSGSLLADGMLATHALAQSLEHRYSRAARRRHARTDVPLSFPHRQPGQSSDRHAIHSLGNLCFMTALRLRQVSGKSGCGANSCKQSSNHVKADCLAHGIANPATGLCKALLAAFAVAPATLRTQCATMRTPCAAAAQGLLSARVLFGHGGGACTPAAGRPCFVLRASRLGLRSEKPRCQGPAVLA